MKSEHLAEAKRKGRSRGLPTIINYKDTTTFNNNNDNNENDNDNDNKNNNKHKRTRGPAILCPTDVRSHEPTIYLFENIEDPYV